MALEQKRVSFGGFKVRKFRLPKKRMHRNASIMGEHYIFWQTHESLERREHRTLSKRTHALLALGRATELRAAVEEYMREPAPQVPQAVAAGNDALEASSQQQQQHHQQQQSARSADAGTSRRPPPPARRQSKSAGHSKVEQLPVSQGTRSLDGQQASSSNMFPGASAFSDSAPAPSGSFSLKPGSYNVDGCDGEHDNPCSDSEEEEDEHDNPCSDSEQEDEHDSPCSDSEEEEDNIVLGHASSFESTFDNCEPVITSPKVTADLLSAPRTEQLDKQVSNMTEMETYHATKEGHVNNVEAADQELLHDGHTSTFRGNCFRRRLRGATIADPTRVALELRLQPELPLNPEPPQAEDSFARPPARTYRRPLRAYTLPVEVAADE
eukprot:TRINITY_DN18614_c0_g1_i1.p1 TRINITY_DN18614_c0_g1~~TRINITY_DN18614_c0_g1_i1.p1  ORF type:complete len:382 (+),score=70.57 TRINITY_DN18614_c0_g1_i1:73-1218(+)